MALDFETYSAQLSPYIRKVAWKYHTPHPYLGYQDLVQEGLLALFQVWERLYPTKSPTDLLRIGVTAVWRRIRDIRHHAFTRGEFHPSQVSLDAPVEGRAPQQRVKDLVVGESFDFGGFVVDLECLVRNLSDQEQQILAELTNPSMKTLREYRRRQRVQRRQGQQRGAWKGRLREEVIGKTLSLTPGTVGKALTQIKKEVKAVFCCKNEPTVERSPSLFSSGGSVMATEKAFMPDEMLDVGLPPIPDTRVDEGKPATKKVAKGNGKKAEPKKAEPKKAEPKKAEPKKAEPKKAEPKKPVGPILPNGTAVKYLGGSRARNLKEGLVGVILSRHGTSTVRYQVRFTDGNTTRVTTLAQKYVQETKAPKEKGK